MGEKDNMKNKSHITFPVYSKEIGEHIVEVGCRLHGVVHYSATDTHVSVKAKTSEEAEQLLSELRKRLYENTMMSAPKIQESPKAVQKQQSFVSAIKPQFTRVKKETFIH
jgi:hypothetical protein